MRIEQFDQLLKIETHKTLSQVARELFISQPSLSASLNQVEEELRLKIFQRSNSGLIPTEQGKEVLRLAKNIMELTEKIKSVKDGKGVLLSHMQMIIPADMATSISPELLKHFKIHYPDVNLHIHETSNDNIVDLMDSGEYSIGVISCSKNQEKDILKQLKEKHFTFDLIPGKKQSEKVVYISARNPLSDSEKISLTELEGLRMLSYKENYLEVPNEFNYLTNKLTVVNDMEYLKKLVAEDFGYSIFPRFFANNDLYVIAQKNKLIPIKNNFCTNNIYVLYTSKELLTTIEEELRILLGQQLKTLTASG
ncbi:MAG: LysR family transcriptional regulator [Dehalobacterium sp.]